MALTNAGRDAMITGISTGTFTTPFTQANIRVGVGDSTTAFAQSQTDLQAATNKLRKSCTSANWSTNVLTIVTDFTTAEANYVWAEWGVFNAASAGTMLSRKQEALGTKTSAQSWTLTTTLTFAAA